MTIALQTGVRHCLRAGLLEAPLAAILETDETTLDQLIEQISAIRSEMMELETAALAEQYDLHDSHRDSAKNLVHYLALRRHDLRDIQERLAAQGLSSLGRAESHAKANVDAIDAVLRRLAASRYAPPEPNGNVSYREGLAVLRDHTDTLLGPEPDNRRVRIMVTMPAEAADDYELVRQLLLSGMNCMRINCAYDDVSAWSKMIENLHRAIADTGINCRILMDLAGPKLRTGAIEKGPAIIKWRPERNVYGRLARPARVWLTSAKGGNAPPEPAAACLPITGNGLSQLRVGDVLKFFDSRGASRCLRAVETADDGWWAESTQTTYINSGTVLHLYREGQSIRTFSGRVGKLPPLEQRICLNKGDTLVLTRSPEPGKPPVYNARGQLISLPHISVTLPEIFDDVRSGEAIWFDNGAIGGVIKRVREDEIEVTITHTSPRGNKLRADKGINLPDSELRLQSLTNKDLNDLRFIATHADIVGYSFVRRASDVQELQKQLALLGGRDLGIVLKIETRRAFDELASLLLALMRSPAAGVMIARGDLAIECGWERMAEVQEEILWICEAAHLPVIWATQVLESLAKNGLPSRAEITDAAMGERAECVMLNKGPYVLDAVRVLDDILQRMEQHQSKKRSMLRHLRLADHLPERATIRRS
jgi:pyruvate kinase